MMGMVGSVDLLSGSWLISLVLLFMCHLWELKCTRWLLFLHVESLSLDGSTRCGSHTASLFGYLLNSIEVSGQLDILLGSWLPESIPKEQSKSQKDSQTYSQKSRSVTSIVFFRSHGQIQVLCRRGLDRGITAKSCDLLDTVFGD